MAINPNKICLNTLFLMHGLATIPSMELSCIWLFNCYSLEKTLFHNCFIFLQSVRWSWSAATCLLPCLRVFLCSEQTIQLIHLSVSLSAICEILEATCLSWCLLNFQLRSQGSTSPRTSKWLSLPTSSTCSSSSNFFRLKQFECGGSGWN